MSEIEKSKKQEREKERRELLFLTSLSLSHSLSHSSVLTPLIRKEEAHALQPKCQSTTFGWPASECRAFCPTESVSSLMLASQLPMCSTILSYIMYSSNAQAPSQFNNVVFQLHHVHHKKSARFGPHLMHSSYQLNMVSTLFYGRNP